MPEKQDERAPIMTRESIEELNAALEAGTVESLPPHVAKILVGSHLAANARIKELQGACGRIDAITPEQTDSLLEIAKTLWPLRGDHAERECIRLLVSKHNAALDAGGGP